MNLLVVGAGEMGRWFADAAGDAVEAVAFADADPAVAEAAAGVVGGRAVAAPPDDTFDAVCVAVPIPAATEVIARYADHADRALVDVTGVMEPAVAAMAEHAPGLERVSLHPLFAPAAAPGTIAVVPDAPGPVTDELRAVLAAEGNRLFETTAAEHDEAMTAVQGAAHAALLAYGLAAGDVPESFHTPVSKQLADLAERVTDGNPRVYADIQDAFGGAPAVAAAAERVAAAAADAEEATFTELYETAGRRVRGHERVDEEGGASNGEAGDATGSDDDVAPDGGDPV